MSQHKGHLVQLKANGRKPPKEYYFSHRLEMLESKAWGSLPLVCRRVLDILEAELLRQWPTRGNTNGRLIITYRQFASRGVSPGGVLRAIKRLVDNGFLEIVERGSYSLDRGKGRGSRYRLTYFKTGEDTPPTDDWR